VPFSSLATSLNRIVADTLSDWSITVFHHLPGLPIDQVKCITKNPALEEDYLPGSAPPQGTGVLLLWVDLADFQSLPQKGDTALVGGVDYDIWQVDDDRENGATLRCRKRGQRYDQ